MSDWRDWLQKGKDWVKKTGETYAAGDQESRGLGSELAAKRQMVDEGRKALGQAPAVAPAVAPQIMPQPVGMTPMDAVNPGYQPIGGQNALDQLYRGQAPALLPPPAARRVK